MYSLLFSLANAYSAPSLTSTDHQSCPADSAASCSGSGSDSCCYEATNGVFLSTQFWDYNPATGPADAFTLHGLWSDKCGGGYNQFCNKDWEISGVRTILQSLGKTDLLSKMDTYWKNYDGSDDELWEHEYNKHGTCMYTLGPDCYSGGDANEHVGDFYTSTFSLYESLPTYKWLTEAGISPDDSKTYSVDDIHSVLSKNFDNKKIYLGCDDSNALQEVWYFYSLTGSVANGKFTPADSISSSTCKDGMKWIPKSGGSSGETTTTTSDSGDNTATATTSDGSGEATGTDSKGTLNIDGQSGCLISGGKWYTSGTCATFTVTSTVGGVSVSSSKGSCGVVDGAFSCGSSVTASDFTLDGGYLSYGGSTEWSADEVPSGTTQESVSAGSGSVTFKIKFSS